jgi:lathosterol oxidase
MDVAMMLFGLTTLIALERLPAFRLRAQPLGRGFFSSDLFYLLTGGIGLSLAMRSLAMRWFGLARLSEVFAAMPFPLVVVLAIVIADLGAYVSHISLHRVDVLWAFHKVHHSSRALDWLATFRAHLVEHALRHLLSPVVLIVLGFPLAAIALASGITAVWSAFDHANTRLRLLFLEGVFVTPRLHRMHHVPVTSDRNFGAMLSVWDRWFGTLAADREAAGEPLGVPGEVETYPQGWLPQFAEPWRQLAAPTWRRLFSTPRPAPIRAESARRARRAIFGDRNQVP